MADLTIEIVNMPEIRAAFQQAPAKMTEALNYAIQRSIFEIQGEEFNQYLDLGIRVITAGLYDSIQAGVYYDNLRGEVGPNAQGQGVDYAIYVHDGTRYMAARPFLLQAIQAKDDSVQQEFRYAVQSVLDDIGDST